MTWLIFIDDLHLDFPDTGRIRDMLRKISVELIQDGDSFAMTSSGPSRIALDVTMDQERLAAAIKNVIGNGLKYEDIQRASSLDEVYYRASTSLTTASSLLASARDLPEGTPAMLFISNGYALRSPDIEQQLATLTANATALQVPIFAVHPRAALASSPVAGPTSDAFLAAQLTMLRSVSEQTDGFAIVDGDFAEQIRRIADAMHPSRFD